MRNTRYHVHKGWLLHRLDKLSESAPTSEVARILKVSPNMLHKWTQDPYFRQNKIAVRGNLQWLWDKEKLRWWLIFVYKLGTPSEIAENPGGKKLAENGLDYITAGEYLGIPPNYSVWLGREKIAGDIVEEEDEE